jgi:tRNA U34 5-methylaminomethyl-2-thiouridine-forming methyltransferase MnmC
VAINIIVTEDGSHSLLNLEMNETYHSRHGAMLESNYVFIEKGLDYLFLKKLPKVVSILEIGFGTGLNAWLSWQWAEKLSSRVMYHTLEAFPISEEIWKLLNYGTTDSEVSKFRQLHSAPWQQWQQMDACFSLFKDNNTLQLADIPTNHFDLIYFDAFAPNKQPEMWELPMLEKIVSAMKAHAVFVTYCAKGQLKRDLKSLGLTVESLPGPPGKREMVRAIKI